jgi:putative ABC transport system permease protein
VTRILSLKLARDLWRMKWQVGAIALLIACGVSVAVMSFSALEALRGARDRYYEETHFADVFAVAARAPLAVRRRLAEIDGVVAADTRIRTAGLVDVPGQPRPALGQFISLPEDADGGLNRIVLRQGRLPAPGSHGEAVAVQSFLDAAHVPLGTRLSATTNGRRVTFTVVGSAVSPEFVYAPSPGSTMPDDAHQAVFWMPRAALEHDAGMTGVFNAAALDLAPDTPSSEVIRRADAVLAPYGGRGAYGRKDQPSHAFLDAEFDELQTSASILPPVFLVVAAVLVHMVISRQVQTEREQIGLLKAFGFRDSEVGRQYLLLALLIGAVGVAGGGLLGLWLGAAIVQLYTRYFRIPGLSAQFDVTAFAISGAVALGACAMASIASVRRATALAPAIAMRPPRPVRFRRGWLETAGLTRRLDQPSLMILRQLQRFPLRGLMTIAGLAASLSLLVGTQFLFESLNAVIEHAYFRSQRWSDQLGFIEPRSAASALEAARLPGAYLAEPVRDAAMHVSANGRTQTVLVRGLELNAQLARPLDGAGDPIRLDVEGLVLSETVASRLGVKPGRAVRLQSMDGREIAGSPPVVAIAQDYSGLTAYLPRRMLNTLLREGDLASGANLLVATDRRSDFYASAERMPRVVSATSRDDTVRNWREAMTEAFRRTITFYVGFAAAIAFGVAYNSGRISFAERARDLATLRVLGFRQGECAYIFGGEATLLVAAALPLGFTGGALLARGLVAAYSRNDLRLPAMVTASSNGIALVAFLIAVAVGAVLVGRRIWTLDLVGVLKTRE